MPFVDLRIALGPVAGVVIGQRVDAHHSLQTDAVGWRENRGLQAVNEIRANGMAGLLPAGPLHTP